MIEPREYIEAPRWRALRWDGSLEILDYLNNELGGMVIDGETLTIVRCNDSPIVRKGNWILWKIGEQAWNSPVRVMTDWQFNLEFKIT